MRHWTGSNYLDLEGLVICNVVVRIKAPGLLALAFFHKILCRTKRYFKSLRARCRGYSLLNADTIFLYPFLKSEYLWVTFTLAIVRSISDAVRFRPTSLNRQLSCSCSSLSNLAVGILILIIVPLNSFTLFQLRFIVKLENFPTIKLNWPISTKPFLAFDVKAYSSHD